jgi:hypothetical protein
VAWLGLSETDSILIREKRKHLSKMSDRVSKMFWSASAQDLNEGKYSKKYISIIKVYLLSYNYTSSPLTYLYQLLNGWATRDS